MPDNNNIPAASCNVQVVDAGFRSDVGCTREINEDQAAVIQPSDDQLRRTKGTLAVVADGMGGHTAGEVASRIAIDVVGQSYYASDEPPAEALAAAVIEANNAVHSAASSSSSLRGMGTTCTALAITGGTAVYAHVGDSRLYLVRSARAYQLSEDHSLVMKLVRDGILTVEEARQHPERNVILRALGRQPDVEVSSWDKPLPVSDGDRFVLCSDGLHDLVSDDEIARIASASPSHEACTNLITLACERGAPDNVSVCVLVVQNDGPDAEGSAS
ncbi:MAG: Stp1/IreP family PP2C-type Ser/Thr phosphatase [Acidobacteria bacterium]|nr:Stp1/IreP family PP2C-type Ser/Thr phosphatase [Acidobacteriota bacterium]